MKVNILINEDFFFNHSSYGFVFPIIKSINLIKELGVNINFLYTLNKSTFDCDCLIIDSRFNDSKFINNEKYIEYLSRSKKSKIIYADTADNSGQIKSDFLDIVDIYWKGQILKKKKEYMKKHYGGRLFTSYYNKAFRVTDKNEAYSQPVRKEEYLKKIKVCWNMGLADHGHFAHLRQKLFNIFKFKFLINNTKKFFSPNNKKNQLLSCRIGIKYGRETVQFQRNKIYKIFKNKIKMKKLSRNKYLNEIKNSKYIISPFGWGEICPRDFETFLNGGILLKPNMEPIDTWPNWYKAYKTYIPLPWDLKNLKKKIDMHTKNYKKNKEIAICSQNKYLKFTIGLESKKIFALRFFKLINS